MGEYLTIREVKDLLQVSERTVRRWITLGALPALKIGRSVRVRREDIDMQTRTPSGPSVDQAAQLTVLQKARQLRERIQKQHGESTSSSVDILRQIRRERGHGR